MKRRRVAGRARSQTYPTLSTRNHPTHTNRTESYLRQKRLQSIAAERGHRRDRRRSKELIAAVVT
jgi:hypothetical protein